ncbi:MAG: M48 family metalloprotease [Firmicutes bacterium]|nr:M48 family metalloprotease [Bacillota bacterium]
MVVLRFSTFKKWPALLVLLLLLVSLGAEPIFAAPTLAEQFEKSLGRGAAPDVIKQYGGEYILPLPERLWLEEIFRRLEAVTERSEIEYTLTVLDSQQWNAFSLPGGYIFITKGLLKSIGGDETKAAAVLGHEIAHVEKKHGVNAVLRQMGLTVLLEVGVFWLDLLSADVLRVASATLLQLLQLGWGREAEFEADALGQDLAVKAGFDAIGPVLLLTDFLEAEDEDLPLGVFRTHPNTDKRRERLVSRLSSFWPEPSLVWERSSLESKNIRRNSEDAGRSDPRNRFRVEFAQRGLRIEDTQQGRFLQWLADYQIHDFRWSPQGSYLAVVAEQNYQRVLLVLDRQGRLLKKSSSLSEFGQLEEFCWSPREKMLALGFAADQGSSVVVTYLQADVYFKVSGQEGRHPVWTEEGLGFARRDGWYRLLPPEVIPVLIPNPVPLVLQRKKSLLPTLIREGDSIRLTRPALSLP